MARALHENHSSLKRMLEDAAEYTKEEKMLHLASDPTLKSVNKFLALLATNLQQLLVKLIALARIFQP